MINSQETPRSHNTSDHAIEGMPESLEKKKVRSRHASEEFPLEETHTNTPIYAASRLLKAYTNYRTSIRYVDPSTHQLDASNHITM